MYINEIDKVTIPILKEGFPWKLFFDGETPWMEAYSFEREEIREFEKVNPDLTLPEHTTLMSAAGFVNENGAEYEAYAVYSYEGKVYFLTVNRNGEYHTYDYARSMFVVWKD